MFLGEENVFLKYSYLLCFSLTGTGEDLRLIKPTFTSLVERLVADIRPENIMLSTKVTRVYQYKNRIELLSKAVPKLTAKIVILAIPLQDEHRITFFPTRPKMLMSIPLPRRPLFVSTFNARFEDAFWRRNGCSGSFMLRERHFSAVLCETGPNSLSGIVFHENDDPAYEPQLDVLAELYDQFEDADTVHYTCQHQNWPQSMYRGFSAAGLNDGKRLLRASANTATLNRGWCDGAVQAGQRSALLAMMRINRQLVDVSDLGVDALQSRQKRRQAGTLELAGASCNLYNCAFAAILMPLAFGVFWFGLRRCGAINIVKI